MDRWQRSGTAKCYGRTLRVAFFKAAQWVERGAGEALRGEPARAEGPGHNYLVEHSAGIGKSNTIGWLAHRLAQSATEKTADRIRALELDARLAGELTREATTVNVGVPAAVLSEERRRRIMELLLATFAPTLTMGNAVS